MAQQKFASIALEGALPEAFAPVAYLVSGHLEAEANASLPASANDDGVKSAVRALLRFGGYKPSGRGRPASESLAKAVVDGRWPTIHPLVDECNRLSLRSGLPISVVDAQLLTAPLSLRIGQPGEQYVFNPSGQELDVKGLLLLADASGPTGSPVKDAQRSKVSQESRDFLIVIWGTSVAAALGEQIGQDLESWCLQRGASCHRLAISA